VGPQTLEEAVSQIVANYGAAMLVFVAPLALAFFAKEWISNRIGGFWWKRKGYYREEMYVEVDGELGQIVYIGNYETKFYIFIVNANKEICGKWGLKVLNNDLRKRRIKVLIANVQLPNTVKGIYV
jgi:hypothetical protein